MRCLRDKTQKIGGLEFGHHRVPDSHRAGHQGRAGHGELQQAAEDHGEAVRLEVEAAVALADVATDHLRPELGRGAAHGEEETWDRVEGEERGELNDWSLTRRGLDRAVGMRSQGEATRGLKGYR